MPNPEWRDIGRSQAIDLGPTLTLYLVQSTQSPEFVASAPGLLENLVLKSKKMEDAKAEALQELYRAVVLTQSDINAAVEELGNPTYQLAPSDA